MFDGRSDWLCGDRVGIRSQYRVFSGDGSTGEKITGCSEQSYYGGSRTGAGTLIGSYGVASACGFDTMADIAFDPTTGVLYGRRNVQPLIYRIDIATGQATQFGRLGADHRSVLGSP